jgi:glutaredoxin 3
VVTIYTRQFCGYCTMAKRYLTEVKGVAFTEVDLTGDNAGRADLAQRTGQSTVPQIFVGETHVGGYTDMRALDASGGLDPLLQG